MSEFAGTLSGLRAGLAKMCSRGAISTEEWRELDRLIDDIEDLWGQQELDPKPTQPTPPTSFATSQERAVLAMAVSYEVNDLISKKSMTLSEAARLSGMSPQSIRNWGGTPYRAPQLPSVSSLYAVAAVLDVPASGVLAAAEARAAEDLNQLGELDDE